MWILLIIHLASGQMTQLEFRDYWGCSATQLRLTMSKDDWKRERELLEEWEEKYQAARADPELSEERRDKMLRMIQVSEVEISRTFTEHKTHTGIDAVCIPKDGR